VWNLYATRLVNRRGGVRVLISSAYRPSSRDRDLVRKIILDAGKYGLVSIVRVPVGCWRPVWISETVISLSRGTFLIVIIRVREPAQGALSGDSSPNFERNSLRHPSRVVFGEESLASRPGGPNQLTENGQNHKPWNSCSSRYPARPRNMIACNPPNVPVACSKRQFVASTFDSRSKMPYHRRGW